MSKSLVSITIGAILIGGTAIAQLRLTLAISALVIGTCAALAASLIRSEDTPDKESLTPES